MVSFVKTLLFYLATIALSVSASVYLTAIQSLVADVKTADRYLQGWDGSMENYLNVDEQFVILHSATQKAIADTIALVPSGPSELHDIAQLISQSVCSAIVRLTDDLKPRKAELAENVIVDQAIGNLERMKYDFKAFEKALIEKPSEEEALPGMIKAAFDRINNAVVSAIDFLSSQ
ncbi:hypothetical protein EAE96_002921 [Botrytis aclada]|nr:hypothetical protein EAE96_002921 [Botrytis aclada]